VFVTGKIDQAGGLTSAQRRRRWTAEEKAWIVSLATNSARPRSISRTTGAAVAMISIWRSLGCHAAQ
jgi:hypothetical protein